MLQDKKPSIFDKIDAINWNLFGFSPIWVIKNARVWRIYIGIMTVLAFICHVYFGPDSTWEMLVPYQDLILKHPSDILTILQFGSPASVALWHNLSIESQSYYGIGNHFTAPVIYGLFFIILSFYLERNLNIKKSHNFAISGLATFAAMGTFEVPWNYFYATLQHQVWTWDFFHYKQGPLITMYSIFVVLFFLLILHFYAEGYKLRLDALSYIMGFTALGLWVLWIYYPFPTQTLSVQTTAGLWTSGRYFPQTFYAIDLDPLDNIAIGHAFHILNDQLHLINTLAKIFQTFFILRIFAIIPNKRDNLNHKQ